MKKLYSPTHEVTPLTMAVIAQQDEFGNTSSYVLEEQGEYFVQYAPSKVIDYACRFFGASLKGRQEGTRAISELSHKVPISIDPSSGMYFFPTSSPTNPKCSWIAHTHLSKINEVANQCTEVIFKNGQRIIVDVSFGSMMNQVNRTAQFRYKLDDRIKELQRHRIKKKPESD